MLYGGVQLFYVLSIQQYRRDSLYGMDRFILLKQYDRLLHLLLVCFLIFAVLSVPGCGNHTENGGKDDKTVIVAAKENEGYSYYICEKRK